MAIDAKGQIIAAIVLRDDDIIIPMNAPKKSSPAVNNIQKNPNFRRVVISAAIGAKNPTQAKIFPISPDTHLGDEKGFCLAWK